MAVSLPPGDVQALWQPPPERARLLRLGWLYALPDVESLDRETLLRALASRGVVLRADDPADVQALLPPAPESDSFWRLRRAVERGAL